MLNALSTELGWCFPSGTAVGTLVLCLPSSRVNIYG